LKRKLKKKKSAKPGRKRGEDKRNDARKEGVGCQANAGLGGKVGDTQDWGNEEDHKKDF